MDTTPTSWHDVPAQPNPVDWTTKRLEEDARYKAQLRLRELGVVGMRAAEGIVELHDYITKHGSHHPILEAELRSIEDLATSLAHELIVAYVRRR
ncbi:MAG TPA: hypothetical protein VIV12_06585 [Streptosporangiaceae bacterium]